MDEELRNRLDALDIAMRAVTSTLNANVNFVDGFPREVEAFIRALPPDQAHRSQALREATKRLRGIPSRR